MKMLMIISLFAFTFSPFAQEKAVVKKNELKVKARAKAEVTKAAKTLKAEVPCDSKEDILKKLEERKKAEAATKKAFSLQGGDTGCTIK